MVRAWPGSSLGYFKNIETVAGLGIHWSRCFSRFLNGLSACSIVIILVHLFLSRTPLISAPHASHFQNPVCLESLTKGVNLECLGICCFPCRGSLSHYYCREVLGLLLDVSSSHFHESFQIFCLFASITSFHKKTWIKRRKQKLHVMYRTAMNGRFLHEISSSYYS